MRSILEKALIALLNEEKDKADALFHDFILERSRQIHESLRQGEDFVLDESWEQELAIDEMFTAEDLEGDEEAPQVGDTIDHTQLGTVEVLEVTEKDVYGAPAQYLVKLEDGDTQEVSYDYLVGALDTDYLNEAEDAEETEGEDADVDSEADTTEDETDEDAEEGDTTDSDEDDTEEDEGDEGEESGDLASEVHDLEDEVGNIKDELARLAAEFDALMDQEGGEQDAAEDDGEDAKKEVEEAVDGDTSDSDEDEDYDKLGESIVDALERVNGKNAEGLTTGDKQPVDTKSRALVTAPEARQAGKPVKVKSDDKNGFDREAAPKVDTMKPRKNTFKRASDSRSPVANSGSKDAILNSLGDDKTSQKGIFDKKRV